MKEKKVGVNKLLFVFSCDVLYLRFLCKLLLVFICDLFNLKFLLERFLLLLFNSCFELVFLIMIWILYLIILMFWDELLNLNNVLLYCLILLFFLSLFVYNKNRCFDWIWEEKWEEREILEFFMGKLFMFMWYISFILLVFFIFDLGEMMIYILNL